MTVFLQKCKQKHVNLKWSSQPQIKRLQLGDFAMCVAILLSGNGHKKIALMNKFMNLGVVSRTTHYHLQSLYTVTIHIIAQYWNEKQLQFLDERKGKHVVLMG